MQDVEISKDHVLLKCTFLQGVTTKTCFIVVRVNNKTSHILSGSNPYTINLTKGNYTLVVYDNEVQAKQGVEPAKIVTVGKYKRYIVLG